MDITAAILDQMNANSLYQTLGIQIDSAANGKAQSRLIPDPAVCWPFPDQPHGGVLFTLIDTTMAWAVWSQLDPGYNCTTINIDIHYLKPAHSKVFVCSAWSTHKTGRSSFVRADIHNAEGEHLVMGQGTFRIIPVDLLK
ncbi:MAG: PaaI family thioesterase [Desulfobacterales bacterium]|nr:PaaI family thioesterase [Desulfobacterales bacterium]